MGALGAAVQGYDVVMETGLFGVVLTVVVLIGIAVLILLFERRRAREIVHDPERLPPREGDEGRG